MTLKKYINFFIPPHKFIGLVSLPFLRAVHTSTNRGVKWAGPGQPSPQKLDPRGLWAGSGWACEPYGPGRAGFESYLGEPNPTHLARPTWVGLGWVGLGRVGLASWAVG